MKNISNKLKFIIVFVIIILIIDFPFTFLLKKKIDLYNIYYPQLDHRVSNSYYHHAFKSNVNTYDIWGPYKYKFYTNSLGFKDKESRIVKVKSKDKRIVFIGDSFTEGIGFQHQQTFIGILEKKLIDSNIELLNAGVASQSPTIYLSKIKYFIENNLLNFDELIVFLDISDIPDEVYYQKEIQNQNTESLDLISRNLGVLLSKNFTTILFYNVVIEKIEYFKRNLEVRYQASKKFKKNFFNVKPTEINLYKSIVVKRGNWTHDDNFWNKYGLKGRKIANSNLSKLLTLCKENNIKFSLVVYPWPSQIYHEIDSNRHRLYWEEWSQHNKVDFYDLFKYFNNGNKIEVINKYFIEGDIHWNKIGHEYIAQIIYNEYFDKKL